MERNLCRRRKPDGHDFDARRKLGDTPSQPRYIETIRKSGYRFVAPVTRQSRAADGYDLGRQRQR
ncbi:MAG: hypothetical protein DMF84_06145 [Acidobacteria bacterium]|nr:MAG: hypothetical protein DMF84_06145 [Acidobacteriota bacterium]